MKKIMIAILLVLLSAAPSYALSNQNPLKKVINRVSAFFREDPFHKQRRLIQKMYRQMKSKADSMSLKVLSRKVRLL